MIVLQEIEGPITRGCPGTQRPLSPKEQLGGSKPGKVSFELRKNKGDFNEDNPHKT